LGACQLQLIIHEGYPSRLFNLRDDPEEFHDLIDREPETATELTALLDGQVDRKATFELWSEWRRHNFAQFQRQAKRGLYSDNSYSLRGNPSSDYHDIMNNAFTGWTEEDEARVGDWLEKR